MIFTGHRLVFTLIFHESRRDVLPGGHLMTSDVRLWALRKPVGLVRVHTLLELSNSLVRARHEDDEQLCGDAEKGPCFDNHASTAHAIRAAIVAFDRAWPAALFEAQERLKESKAAT